MRSLDDKRVLITGGAQGMGLTIAQHLAARGALILLTDLDETKLAEARRQIEEAGGRCRIYPLDVTDHATIAAVRNRIESDTGPAEILINNAGVVFGGAFLEVPLEQHLLTQRVNLEGLIAVTHAFLPDLIAAPEGHLVNISSASGFVGLPWGSTYAASKWGVIGFSESIRLELKRQSHRHVGVTTVCPSYVATGMFEGVHPPRLTSFLTADQVAGKVLRAILDRDTWVLEPWLVKVTPFLKGVLPGFLSDFLADAFGASTSMKSWRGHGDG